VPRTVRAVPSASSTGAPRRRQSAPVPRSEEVGDGPAAAGAGQTIAGIERALDALSLFADSDTPSLGVTEIAQKLGLSKAVVHRILASFRAKGFVELDETTRRYSLGPKILFLCLSHLDRIDVVALAREAMAALSTATNETATLSLRSGHERVYVDQVTPQRDVKMQVQLGTPYPLHAGASSKAFLAFLPPAEIDAYLAEQRLSKLTPSTVTDVRALRRELAQIREQGYAKSFGERMDGAAAVAAPIFDRAGQPAGVVSVCGPVERFRDVADDAAALLLEQTRRASMRLGHVSA
jgi:IclR family transcriptional regulator, acetate operon repressor